ncbi:hypothetical protein PSPO01_15822, partial [Paraphaeosphaeria sporulosa]
RGHETIVKLLLDAGADVNAQGGEYGNALQAASDGGHEAVVKVLVDKGADINAQGGRYGKVLQAASYRGHETIVKLLLEKGADINAQGEEYGDALQAASEGGHEAIVKLLVDKGADVNAPGGYFSNALYTASEGGHEAIVKVLVDKGADINAQGGRYGNVLQAASYRGHETIVKLLLDAGADVNAQGGEYGNALQAASAGGHEPIVKLLLDAGADVNAQGGRYGNALQAASDRGHETIVKLLLDAGADVNAQGGWYGNALQAASWGGDEAIVKLLLEKGADVNAPGGYSGNALQAASEGGHEALVKVLVDKGANVNAQGGEYGNALQAASWRGDEAIVKLLLEKGADVNAQGGYFSNALQAASYRGHETVVKLLLDAGADVNAQGGEYGNALQAASWGGDEAIVKQLLNAGADSCLEERPAPTSRSQSLSDVPGPTLADALDAAQHSARRNFGDHEDVQDQDPTPRGNNEPWRFTPYLLDPNSFACTSFANQPRGYYTPTSGTTNTLYHSQAEGLRTPSFCFGLGTPLSLPVSEGGVHAGQTAATGHLHGFHPHALGTHHQFQNQNPLALRSQHAQSSAPQPFTHGPSASEHAPLAQTHENSPMDNVMPDVEMQEQSPIVSFAPIQAFEENIQPTLAQPPMQNFRYHVTLNAPTAMIKYTDEIPVTYLNKGQAYSISLVDTAPNQSSTVPVKYRTFIRISFENEHQRRCPAACWHLWKEGRGTKEAHQREGRLQAIEFVGPSQVGGGEVQGRPGIELDSASFDCFAVTWISVHNIAPEFSISVRFNFLSTDFSYTKGVKGIPVRLCAKTELLTTVPGSPLEDSKAELCYCKVKLFRDHGAERKRSNDIAHVKTKIVRLGRQACSILREKSMMIRISTPCNFPERLQTPPEPMRMQTRQCGSDKSLHSGGRQDPSSKQPTLFQPPSRKSSNEWRNLPQTAGGDLKPLGGRIAGSDAPKKAQSPYSNDHALFGWIKALDVDQAHQSPPEPMLKPIACFFIKPRIAGKLPDDDYFRAVYLVERTVKALIGGIAMKINIEPTKVTRTIRFNQKGHQIRMDDAAIQEIPYQQDMIAEFHEITPLQPALKSKWVDSPTDIEDGDMGVIKELNSTELRLLF